MTASALQIVIADDHPVFREGLRGVLASMPDVELVAECADGGDAVAAVIRHEADVVLMDLSMPGMGGIEATRQIAVQRPATAVLVLSMLEDDDSVLAALRAGARGYLVKGSPPEDVVRAVRSVAAGEAVFGPHVAGKVLSYFSSPRPPTLPELTDREREVLALIADGRSNKEVAGALFLSPKTVRNHISNIFSKLQVADRAEAIARAKQAGLTPGPGR